MDADETNPPEKIVIAVTTLLFIWTTCFTAVRCWAKTSQQLWSYFDAVFVSAFVACAAQGTTVFLAIAQYGFGSTDDEAALSETAGWMKVTHNESAHIKKPLNQAQALYASDILYIVSIGLSRCSTAFFLSSLTRDQRQKIIGVVIATLAVTWAVASVFAVAMRGDSSRPWAALEPPFIRWIGVESSGLVLELACWLFSANLVWTLNMPILRRLKLIFIFALRMILVPIVAIRLSNLAPAAYHGTTADIAMVQVFTQAAMHFALIAECLTCLRPFMQTFHEGLAPGNANNYWGGLSHTSQPGASNGSGTDNDMKKHMRVTAKQLRDGEGETPGYKRRYRGDDGSMQLRTDRSGFSTRCESERHGHDQWTNGGDDDIELLPTNRSIHVRQTTTMSVSQ